MTEVADFIVLPLEQHQRLVKLAVSMPAEEVCALLGGHEHHLDHVYPVRNVADRPAAEFLLEPEGQIAAMKTMREAGESMRGIFHSHPAASAEPSPTDREQAAYADVYYLILSLLDKPPVMKAFYFDGVDFHPVALRHD